MTTRAVIKFGYREEFVMPIKDAVTILESMAEAEHYESKWEDDGTGNNHDVLYIGGDKKIDIEVKLISEDSYAIGKIMGAKADA